MINEEVTKNVNTHLVTVGDQFGGEMSDLSPVKRTPKKLEYLTDIVCEQLGVDPCQVVPEASFVADLGADSLDLVELAFACKERWGLDISLDEIEHIKTVGQALDYLQSRGVE